MPRSFPVGWLVLCTVSLTGVSGAAIAQSITPANDGTGTVVNETGDRYTITGGSLSRDGANLFHSFERLGLSTDEIATFLSQPNIQNILGRVTGGDASFINGLIQLQGGNSNLYLMNPAGIVFGPNATLDLPGSFFATSANGIGFGDVWFDAVGDNTYADLVGTPNGFAFSLAEPGSIANLGDLAVDSGETLALIGGTVLNAGTLSAPDGTITLAAIPGENRVRLSQAGSLLSLELEPLNGAALNPVTLTPLSLPELLTGGNVPTVDTVSVNPDGTLQLGSSDVAVQNGMAIATGTIDVSGLGDGQIAVLGDRVGLFSATLDASGITGGGDIRVGGDYQGNGNVFNANRTFISADSQLLADALETGDGGRIIVWADEVTRYYGSLSARGGLNGGDGGFAEVSGLQSLDYSGTADLGATLGAIGTLLLDPENITVVSIPPARSPLSDNDEFSDPGTNNFVATGDIALATANVILQATNRITFNDAVFINASGVGLTAQANTIVVNADITTNGGDIRLEAEQGAGGRIEINSANLRSNGGDIVLLADSNITSSGALGTSSSDVGGDVVVRSATGNIRLTDIGTSGNSATGDITLTANSGSIQVGTISSFGLENGTISIDAGDSIITGNLDGGEFSLNADRGSVTTGNIFANSLDILAGTDILSGRISTFAVSGGDVSLEAGRDIQVGYITAFGSSSSGSDEGGDITVLAGGFFRAIDSFSSSTSSSSGTPSRISIETNGGTIFIRHGGNGATPFVIGPDFGENGTLGAITDGESTFEVGESFNGSVVRGNITIETAGSDGDCEVDCENDDIEYDDGYEEVLDFPEVELAQANLAAVEQDAGITPALVYVGFAPAEVAINAGFGLREAAASQEIASYLNQDSPIASPLLTVQPQEEDELEILLVTGSGDPTRVRVDGVTRGEVMAVRQAFMREINNPSRLRTQSYLTASRQLYNWFIRPIEGQLQEKGIDNLAFIMDEGLRTLPIAALHDGDQFLVERYSVGMMPSVSLTDTRYVDIRNLPVLAMGASRFDTLSPLPAVPTELETVTAITPNSVALLNDDFTQVNLVRTREERPFGIVHLATHAEFLPGSLENSYIQFGDRRLTLDQVRSLRLNEPPIELLVLSACKTAVGDSEAELGFGGLAVQTGARSAIASLWYVSDTGTLAFMSDFYRQLREAPVRAEALRQTQISLLRGEVRIENGQILLPDGTAQSLPPELASTGDLNLTHPYFWAAFTMIGSPW